MDPRRGVLSGSRPGLPSDPATRAAVDRAMAWARGLGIDAIVGSSCSILPSDEGAFEISFMAVARNGVRNEAKVVIDGRAGEIDAARPYSHWSSTPDKCSLVLVAPDIVTFWKLMEAVGGNDIQPLVIVAPVGVALPPEWRDPGYWDFGEVVVLADDPLRPSPVVTLLAEVAQTRVRVATPSDAATWRGWFNGARLDHAALEAVAADARDATDFTRVIVGRHGLPTAACPTRELDGSGRLCRHVVAGDGAQRTTAPPLNLIVRSDRTCAPVVGWGPSDGADLAIPWPRVALDRFVAGEISLGSEVGSALASVLGLIGPDGAAICLLSSFVAMTYVFQALEELPLLVVRGGSPCARMALRRALAALCFSTTCVARTRAANIARVADARPGTLLLEEPGALSGPSGSTEIGRLLESGVVRDASPYNRVAAGCARPLELFGPKLVVSSRQSVVGLACEQAVVDLAEGPVTATLPSDRVLAELRSGLLSWSMGSFQHVAKAISDAGGTAAVVLPVVAGMLAIERPDGEAASSPTRRRSGVDPTAPARVMETILQRCGSGSWISMAQVMLEAALVGGDHESFSPERVGRWLAARPEIDGRRAMQRRRLYGQVSRIYPLAREDCDDADATVAFGFCTARACRDCRYESVCESTFPGMRATKNRR